MVESQPSKLLVASSILVSRSRISIVYGVLQCTLHTIAYHSERFSIYDGLQFPNRFPFLIGC